MLDFAETYEFPGYDKLPLSAKQRADFNTQLQSFLKKVSFFGLLLSILEWDLFLNVDSLRPKPSSIKRRRSTRSNLMSKANSLTR